ncbi:MAG: EAL domain-containing protein, partial [Methyloprofundus sp.]|nr:EAL domain-containing protein [Methyloprofundus sp.]
LSIRRETLYTVTEALETSILELQSLNEEAQVSNEELQSTNEELETSNEELQSTNEELTVLNDALADKTEELEDINDDFENVLNSIQNAVLVVDESLTVHQFNETSRHFFNFDTLNNKRPNLSSIEAFFHAEALIGKIKQVIKTGVVFQDTLIKQGQYYELIIYPYLNKRSKNKPGVVITIRDITEKYKAEQKIHTAAKVFEAASEGIMITDKDKLIVSVNPAFTLITGYSYNDVIGKSPRILSSGQQDKVFYLQMWDGINSTGKWQGRIWNRHKKGGIYPEWLSISSLTDKEGGANGYIGIFSDITNLVKAQQTIQQQANFDSLTQLPNRNLFFDRLQQAMVQAKRSNHLLGIMFIDLDGFKVINDSLGHSQGDIILQQIAERMKQVSRESDVFARFGGDEFTCLISNIKSVSDIIPFAEKLLQAIDTPVTVNDITLHITASIGISIYPANGDDAETLIKHADNAMYKAKEEGRNTYQFFTSQMHEQVLNHYRMGNDLKFAIKHNKFQVYYQPVVELKTLRIIGAEALIRWPHPTKGELLPEEFIHIAEDLNLISAIGELVLGSACRFMARLNKELQQSLHIAINFSNQQFIHQDCVEKSLKIIAESQIDMKHVIVEITESQMIAKQVHFIEQLNILRDNGIQIAMDDFGTGYSSLSFLKQIPLDILKIDKSFVQDILTDQSDASLVEAILDIASNFGLKVVAEGVELAEHVDFLNERDCLFAQGYYFSKPIPEEEFVRLVQKGVK